MKDSKQGINITDFDLMAYVDGGLSPQRHAAVAAWLGENPDVMRRLEADIKNKARLKATFDAALHEPVPARIMAVLEQAESQSRRGPRFSFNLFSATGGWRQGLAFSALACVFALAGWQAASLGNGGSAVEGEQTPVLIGSLSDDDNLPSSAVGVKKVAAPQPGVENDSLNWLTQKIALESRAPDLSAHGFSLQDRRLVTLGDHKAVELVYTGSDGTPVFLLMKARWQENPPAVKLKQSGNSQVAYWEDGPLSYAIKSPEINHELGMKLAKAIKENMDGSQPEPQLDFRSNEPTDQRVRLDTLTPLQPQGLEVQQLKPAPRQVQEKF